jgi:DNA-binding beta-propeller fold protein YncE
VNEGSVTELSALTGALVQVLHSGEDDFDGDVAITSDGTHVWVANFVGNCASPCDGPGVYGSVTELSASTGDLVQVVTNDGFDEPVAIASDGTDVWVANQADSDLDLTPSISELSAATGDLVQVLSASSYGLNDPTAVASDGAHVWVTNGVADSVTEFSATTGD